MPTPAPRSLATESSEGTLNGTRARAALIPGTTPVALPAIVQQVAVFGGVTHPVLTSANFSIID